MTSTLSNMKASLSSQRSLGKVGRWVKKKTWRAEFVCCVHQPCRSCQQPKNWSLVSGQMRNKHLLQVRCVPGLKAGPQMDWNLQHSQIPLNLSLQNSFSLLLAKYFLPRFFSDLAATKFKHWNTDPQPPPPLQISMTALIFSTLKLAKSTHCTKVGNHCWHVYKTKSPASSWRRQWTPTEKTYHICNSKRDLFLTKELFFCWQKKFKG